MLGDYDIDAMSNIDISSISVEVLSVTTTTLPSKDIVYIYRTSCGTTTRVVSHKEQNLIKEENLPTNRFKQIILELEG